MSNVYQESAIKTVPQDEGESKLITQLNEWLRTAEGSTPETNWRTEMEEDYAFYAGDQDTQDVKTTLANQKRPTTTYNEVKPKIDMLIGLGAQMKQSPVLIPRGNEDEAFTELMNGVMKWIRYDAKISRKEMECFEHMVKSGRSYLHFYLDSDNPFEPEIRAKFLHGRDVLVDPDSTEYDMSDARYIFISKWFTEDDIKVIWPSFPFEGISQLSQQSNDKPAFFDPMNKKYRIVECWYRTYESAVWFRNPLTGNPEWLRVDEFQKFAQMAQTTGIPAPNGQFIKTPVQGITRPKQVIRYAHFSGDVLLEEGVSPYVGDYASKSFPIIQFGAYKNDYENRWFSVITMMKDPQRGLNTTRRQLIHMLQTAPKGILIHEAGAILNEDEYDTRSSEPNYRLVVASGKFDKIKFSDQPQISPIYGQLDELFQASIKNVGGMQDPLLGIQTTSRESGTSVRMRQESSIAVLYILFSNFKESRVNAGKVLLDLIQQYVTQQRWIRIEGQKGVQLMQINTQLNPGQGLNDVSYGRFDVTVDEEVEHLTMREFVLEQLTNFAQANPETIPPELLMEYTNLPFTAKQQVKAYNQQKMAMQQAQAQSEIQKNQAEIELKKAELAIRAKEVELSHKADMKKIEKGGSKE